MATCTAVVPVCPAWFLPPNETTRFSKTELRERVADRDRRLGREAENWPEMPTMKVSESWLHTYIIAALEADFPVSEAVLHSTTWGRDHEGRAHRSGVPNMAGVCHIGNVCGEPLSFWHGILGCRLHDYHTVGDGHYHYEGAIE